MKENQPKKAWYKQKRVWLGVIILLFVIFAVTSPKDTPTKVTDSNQSDSKKEEQKTFNAGDVIAFDGKEVTVAAPERNWNSGNPYITPSSGNEFVKVQVTIENKSGGEAPYNTFDWKMKDSSGVIKDVATVAFGVDGALGSGTLATGGKVSGFLVFEVPAGDEGLTLQYSPSFWLSKKVEIRL